MGCFAAYMDTRLPSNFRDTTSGHSGSGNQPSETGNLSHAIEDKPFTGIFYKILPENSGKERRNHGATNLNLNNPLSPLRDAQRKPDRSINQPNLNSNSRSIVILQSAERPPHFLLLLGGKERLEISAGRNNLFHTILFFLHYIKTKEYGTLGRINLGSSGVNMLWVIDSPN